MSNRRTVLTDRPVAASKPSAREYSLRDTVLPGFSLRVRPSGAKTWVLRRSINGVARRQSLGDVHKMPVAEARARAHTLLANNNTGDAPSKDRGPSFRDFAATYRARRADSWKPSGLRTYDVYMRCTLLPYFADMVTGEITRTQVARWFHDYSAVRPGGANRALAILRTMFNRARDWGVLPDTAANPCRGIARNRTAPRGRILNTRDLKRLGRALDQAVDRWPDQVDASG